MPLHMIKLCVGCDTVEALVERQAGAGGAWTMHTRQTPRRAGEILEGGSLYRVFKGAILCRQPILAIQTVGEGREARCVVSLHPEVVRVAPTPRRAFQGWRYLTARDAPEDLPDNGLGEAPPGLVRRLREIGAW